MSRPCSDRASNEQTATVAQPSQPTASPNDGACVVMTAETPALAAEGLARRFGVRVAVDRVSFAVGRGEVFGLLGPNGAGKSTTARMLTGFLPPTEGQALVDGIDVNRHPSAARRHIGVVAEEANVYADLTVEQNVLLMAELHGVAKGERVRRRADLLQTAPT
jgi:ABC-type multidrug transport system ATPase subunit